MNKDKLAKEILDELLKNHFYNDKHGICWSYIEDTAIEDVDEELAKKIHEYLEV